jgi:plastocyanin
MRINMALTAALLLASQAAQSSGPEHIVNQKGKSFVQKKVTAKVGDRVKFVNDDPFAHNVFSLSDAKSFDLGSYGQGLGKSIVVDKVGIVEVECAVHPDMKMVIEVQK